MDRRHAGARRSSATSSGIRGSRCTPPAVDTQVTDGDAKVWGTVDDVHDAELHQRYARHLYEETGFDLRGQVFDHFFATHLVGAAAVEVGGGHMDVTVWRDGGPEYVVRKH